VAHTNRLTGEYIIAAGSQRCYIKVTVRERERMAKENEKKGMDVLRASGRVFEVMKQNGIAIRFNEVELAEYQIHTLASQPLSEEERVPKSGRKMAAVIKSDTRLQC